MSRGSLMASKSEASAPCLTGWSSRRHPIQGRREFGHRFHRLLRPRGFVLDPVEAQEWIAADPRNAEVVFPYLNGEDLNSRPDTSASRWVIDFNDRSEVQASEYDLPFARTHDTVKPERQKLKPDGSYVMRSPLPERWWQYGEKRPALRSAIAGLPEVLVISRVSKTVMPTRVPTGQVFSDKLDVFATESYGDQAALSSSLHQMWAIRFGATMRADPAYTPSTVFEPFPRPEASDGLDEVGRTRAMIRTCGWSSAG